MENVQMTRNINEVIVLELHGEGRVEENWM